MYRQYDLEKNGKVIREYLPEKTKMGDNTRGWTVIRAHGFSSEKLATIELSEQYKSRLNNT